MAESQDLRKVIADLADQVTKLDYLLRDITSLALIGRIGDDDFGRYLRVFVYSSVNAAKEFLAAMEALECDPQTQLLKKMFDFARHFENSVWATSRSIRLIKRIKNVHERAELGKELRSLLKEISGKESNVHSFRNVIMHMDEKLRKPGPVIPYPDPERSKTVIKVADCEVSVFQYKEVLKGLLEISRRILDYVMRL
ncbi:MAG: hypothetical protein H5T41_11265 [Methanomassiliicoccales archaeon]|nr:hypothetical protein [Methanomassiliicoccales archaeon]